MIRESFGASATVTGFLPTFCTHLLVEVRASLGDVGGADANISPFWP